MVTGAEPLPTCPEELRHDNCLVLFLRFLILLDFGKNLGFFVRIAGGVWRALTWLT